MTKPCPANLLGHGRDVVLSELQLAQVHVHLAVDFFDRWRIGSTGDLLFSSLQILDTNSFGVIFLVYGDIFIYWWFIF